MPPRVPRTGEPAMKADMTTPGTGAAPQLELMLMPAGPMPGMRLVSMEVLNWGTFDKRVWSLNLDGQNGLLTGDIGSGKSTFVDAITTLLVPANRIAYNKAAGAEAKERDLRSYVLGHYKSERGETGSSAKPVALRDYNTYAVILGRFRNEGFGQDVTLAQVFHFRDREGQPTRFYMVAARALSIAEHFRVDGDINALKRRLRKEARVEMHDTFQPYRAAFSRLFGIECEQALDLFHQTVSMKSVGDLTQFVRTHMLEAFDIDSRIEQMLTHFDDLERAHSVVLKAKAQIGLLTPLVEDCDRHAQLAEGAAELRANRDALHGFFDGLKAGLLEKRAASLEEDATRLAARLETAEGRVLSARGQRDGLKQAIAKNGGDRIEALAREIATRSIERDRRRRQAEDYDRLALALELPSPSDTDQFADNCNALARIGEEEAARRAELDNARTDAQVAFRQVRDEHAKLEVEIKSLEGRRSNLPAHILAIRERVCAELRLAPERMPFAGELIEVRKEAREWEGAAERLLHGFALSLLVPDELSGEVAAWVDRTHLRGHLVYYRVRPARQAHLPEPHARSLVHKLAIRPKSEFYGWLDREIVHRFDYACSDNIEELRREERAITRLGQIKARGERHEKDDRHRIDDRTRFVLGWSNEEKIAALKAEKAKLERRLGEQGQVVSRLDAELRALQQRLDATNKLAMFRSFHELDCREVALVIERLDAERRQLEDGSDKLKTLRGQLAEVEREIAELDAARTKLANEHAVAKDRLESVRAQLATLAAELARISDEIKQQRWPALEAIRTEALGEHRLTIEACPGHEHRVRDWLTGRIDAEDKKIARLTEAIVRAMQVYCNAYPIETREPDASLHAIGEYRRMLDELVTEGLPKFEARFKELLNENTINEVAAFQTQLLRERQLINERIDLINLSLREIDYNTGRYIELVAEPSIDQEVRKFVEDLRTCTEGTLGSDEGQEYSEAKFLQVKAIIERFRGRKDASEADKRWTRKVTDVRNWFVFSASERWREDGREHEHYTDSGGKSGGQKEKLAYTVLAASLACQFGIDWRNPRSRSFHFVMIDEAFGRGSDESAEFGLTLFKKMDLQLLVATPLQKIHVIEPFVSAVGFVHNEEGRKSMLRNLTIEQYRTERMRLAG